MNTTHTRKAHDLPRSATKAIFVDTAYLAEHGILIEVGSETRPGVMCLIGTPQSAEELEDAREFAQFLVAQNAA